MSDTLVRKLAMGSEVLSKTSQPGEGQDYIAIGHIINKSLHRQKIGATKAFMYIRR